MSYDFPATIQQDIQQYAQAEHISADEAALKIVRAGLKTIRRKAMKGDLTETEWQQLRTIPIVSFFEKLPESAIDSIEAASKQTRAERFTPRA